VRSSSGSTLIILSGFFQEDQQPPAPPIKLKGLRALSEVGAANATKVFHYETDTYREIDGND
jgi:hypothetical protein